VQQGYEPPVQPGPVDYQGSMDYQDADWTLQPGMPQQQLAMTQAPQQRELYLAQPFLGGGGGPGCYQGWGNFEQFEGVVPGL